MRFICTVEYVRICCPWEESMLSGNKSMYLQWQLYAKSWWFKALCPLVRHKKVFKCVFGAFRVSEALCKGFIRCICDTEHIHMQSVLVQLHRFKE